MTWILYPQRRAACASALAAGLLVAGCASGIAPATTTIGDKAAATKFRTAASEGVAFDAAWWAAFADPAMSRLIEQALATNIDIRLAFERVEQARAGSIAVASRAAPNVVASGSASRAASGLPDEVKRGLPDLRALRGAVDLSWELDVFGGVRAARDASASDLRSAEAGSQAARLLVSAEVARHYFVWQGSRARLARLEQLLALQSDLERLTRSRYAAGQASQFEVTRAAGETRALAAQLPSLRTLVAVSENQLAVLLALAPAEIAAWLPAGEAPRLADIPEMGTGQPLDLLSRRPDLVAASFAMAAEAARLKESQADLLPKFFLAALFGVQDLDINGRDLSPVRYNNLALAFSMPIFNRGRLQAQAERQASRQRASVLQYEKAVLGAFKDVENSLTSLQQERLRLGELREAQDLRQTGIRHARALYREGQIDQLQLIDAQRSLIAAELDTLDSHIRQQLAAVQLYKALGGGWIVPPAGAGASNAAASAGTPLTFQEQP